MNRRKLLSGLAALVGGGSLTVGSGAFTSVSADRNLNVEVTSDDDALLTLDAIGQGFRASETGTPDTVAFSFPGIVEQNGNSNLGLNQNSVYEFDRNSGKEVTGDRQEDVRDGLLKIRNRGTQSVSVYSEFESSAELDIELYDVDDRKKTALQNDPPELSVGDEIVVGFRIQITDAATGEFGGELTIIADQSNI